MEVDVNGDRVPLPIRRLPYDHDHEDYNWQPHAKKARLHPCEHDLDALRRQNDERITDENVELLSLQEICARFIGQNLPFELVQRHPQRVPEEAQKRIAYWSFPLNRKQLLMYAKTNMRCTASIPVKGKGSSQNMAYQFEQVDSMSFSDTEAHWDGHSAYSEAEVGETHWQPTELQDGVEPGPGRLYPAQVTSMTQVGMYLIGAVQNGNVYFNNRQWYTLNKEKNTVCIQFDRGCIVSTDCSCKSTCKWCEHVVTLCTARMNGLLPFEVHPPLSEILTGFNKDQLVKLIQNCCVHPMGDFSRLFTLAVQLKDKESEINEQCGAPDITAGGFIDEYARWQIDEDAVVSQANNHFSNLPCITSLYDLQDLAVFLQNHDENVTIAIKWCMNKIISGSDIREIPSDISSKFEMQAYTPSPKSRSKITQVLMQGLQVFFVDPFISRICKEEVIHQIQSDSVGDYNSSSSHINAILQESTFLVKEHLQPTPQYLSKVLSSLQAQVSEKLIEDSADSCIFLLASFAAVLRYWLFHKHCPNESLISLTFTACKCIFQTNSSDVCAFQDFVCLHNKFESIKICDLLRQVQTLIEYLIYANRYVTTDIVEVVIKVLGTSSVKISHIVNVAPKETLLATVQMEEAILGTVQSYASSGTHVISPALRKMLEEYLHKTQEASVFTWPWSLLQLATLDPILTVSVKKMAQNFFSNPQSILYWRSNKDSEYTPQAVDLTRIGLVSLLGHLFRVLTHDSTQLLFSAINDALPFPVSYCDLSPSHTWNILGQVYAARSGEDQSVLPHFDTSCLREVISNFKYKPLDSTEQENIAKATVTSLSVTGNHLQLIKEIRASVSDEDPSLLFQLDVLVARVSKCQVQHDSSCYNLKRMHVLPLGTPKGRDAFFYFISNWQYCFEPTMIIDTVTDIYNAANRNVGCKEEMAWLVSAVVTAQSTIIQSVSHNKLGTILNILCGSLSPEYLICLLSDVDPSMDGTRLQQIGGAVGQMFLKVKASHVPAEHWNGALTNLKTAFLKILDMLIPSILISESDESSSSILHVSLSCGSKQTQESPLESMDVQMWAPIVCAFNDNAIVERFLTYIHHLHKVRSLKRFPYEFCQDLGILWREYSKTLPPASHNILKAPVFSKIATEFLAEKTSNAHNTIKMNSMSALRVKNAMLLLASIHRHLQLEDEFTATASKLSRDCISSVKCMIERQFVHMSLTAINITNEMLRVFPQLDAESSSIPRVQETESDDEDRKSNSNEPDTVAVRESLRREYATRMGLDYDELFLSN